MYSPLPSSKTLHFQNEAKCTAFLMKMSIICMRMKIIPISKAEQQSDNSQVLSTVENLASLCTAAPPSLPSLYLFLLLFPYSILEIHSSLNYHSYALVLTKLKPGGGGVILPDKVHMGEGNAPRYNRSLFYVSYLTVKV